MSRFLDSFLVGKKRDFGLASFMDTISLSVNLIYAFESPKLDLYSLNYGPFSCTTIGCLVLTIHTI